MIIKYLYTSRIILFGILSLSLNFSFAQICERLSLDSINNPGIYAYETLTEADGIRNGPGYNGATIYYPIDAEPPFAGMAIVPGYVSPESSIQNWGPFLASHGIVTITIGTNSFFDFPADRAEALLDALVTLEDENTRADSPLFGNIDTNRFSVAGWSMGGGGAQLAAAADPTIKACMAFCPWLDGSITSDDLDHAVPLLIFSGEADPTAPPADHADVHYDYTPETTNKMLFEIEGANHSVANDPIGGEDYVGKIAISWLQYFLLGDSCYCPLLLDTPPTASKYLLNVDCPEINTVSIDVLAKADDSYELYPNPCNGSVNLQIDELAAGTNYQIFSMAGSQLLNGEVLNYSTHIAIHDLAPGVYIFNLNTEKGSKQSKFIVQ